MCCLGCGARRKLKTCTRCKVAKFCGADCVARAWPAHKPHCTRSGETRSESVTEQAVALRSDCTHGGGGTV
jgi:hypothetical protein